MKLLITSGIFPPEIGGPATYVCAFAKWLSEKKYGITVVTAQKGILNDTYPFPVEIVKKKGIFFWHIKVFFKIFKILRNFDAIYINGLFSESCVAAILRKKKNVVRIPGDSIWERAIRKGWTNKNFLDFQKDTGNIKIKLLRWFRNLYLSHADKIISPSSFLADIIEKWGIQKKKIKVIYNPYCPVEREPFLFPEESRGKFLIVTGGRLVSWKGVDVVVTASMEIKNSVLFIFGDGPAKKNLKKQVLDLQLSKRTFFVGNLSQSKLKYLFSKSDCFILNSKYEGLPHIIVEAMAAGCPVIASKVGGIPEVIHHNKNGLLIQPDNIFEIISAVEKIKEDKRMRKQLIESGKKTAIWKFSQEKISPKVMDLIF